MNRALTVVLLLTPRLALRNVFRNIRRTLLTVMLISLSLAALMFTDAMMGGMEKLLVSSATELFSGEVQTHRRGFLDTLDIDLYIADTSSLEGRLATSAEVKGFSVRTIAGGMIASPHNQAGGLIYGVDAGQEAGVSRLSAAITQGTYLTGKPREILMGEPLAELLEARLGDRIVTTFASADGGDLSQSLFRISGLFRFGLRELDENVVFINLAPARQAVGVPEGGHEIAINLHRPATDTSPLPLFADLSDDSVLTQPWTSFNPEIGSIIAWVDVGTFMTGAVLFLLATFGITNSLFMSIYERIHEFGIVRALGAEPWQVLLLIVTEALLLAIMSVLVGLAVGAGLIFYFGNTGLYLGEIEFEGIVTSHIFPAAASVQFTAFPAYVICLTLVVSIYPAIYAARLVPADALRRSL